MRTSGADRQRWRGGVVCKQSGAEPTWCCCSLTTNGGCHCCSWQLSSYWVVREALHLQNVSSCGDRYNTSVKLLYRLWYCAMTYRQSGNLVVTTQQTKQQKSTTHISSSWGSSASCGSCCRCWVASDHDVVANNTRHTVTRSSLVYLITRSISSSVAPGCPRPTGLPEDYRWRQEWAESRCRLATPSAPPPLPPHSPSHKLRAPELHLSVVSSHRKTGMCLLSSISAITNPTFHYFKADFPLST